MSRHYCHHPDAARSTCKRGGTMPRVRQLPRQPRPARTAPGIRTGHLIDAVVVSGLLLLVIAMVLAPVFSGRATLALSPNPTSDPYAKMPAAGDSHPPKSGQNSERLVPVVKGFSDSTASSGRIRKAFWATMSTRLAPLAPILSNPFAREAQSSDGSVRTTREDPRHALSDMALQLRREYPAFLGPCPCPAHGSTNTLRAP